MLIMKEESKAQRRANARNQLFRQIHGYSLKPFFDRAKAEGVVTPRECNILSSVLHSLETLKKHQFEGSQEVGLHPRRRCHLCNGIARWRDTKYHSYFCNKCKSKYDDGSYDFIEINPNE